MYKGKYVSVIIASAGMSNRIGSKMNKQFLLIGGKPILAHTIEKFEKMDLIDEIIIVSKEEEIDYCKREIVNKFGFKKVSNIVRGGKERQDSIYNGILALNQKSNIVLSHDGARPFVKIEDIENVIKEVYLKDAAILAVPVKDTIKIVKDGAVDITPYRPLLWAAQTPQGFKKELLQEAYRKARRDEVVSTDDSSLVERLGREVKIVMGSYENIKITTPEDLILGESLFRDLSKSYNIDEYFTGESNLWLG